MNIKAPGQKDIPALKLLWQQAFEDSSAFTDMFFAKGFSPKRSLCLYKEDLPAAALYWFDCRWREKPIAYIYGVATDKAFQNQGLCRALMEKTHRHLEQLGYAGTALVPSSESLFCLYEKLGYRAFCPMERRTVAAQPGSAVALRQISPEEYAQLRQSFLPENGILQGGNTLPFLSSFAQFYAGEKLLFCASREDETLHFQEFLGDAALLGPILNALGAKQGKVRLYGKGPDFAMYRSLQNDPTLPAYFGIAMD